MTPVDHPLYINSRVSGDEYAICKSIPRVCLPTVKEMTLHTWETSLKLHVEAEPNLRV